MQKLIQYACVCVTSTHLHYFFLDMINAEIIKSRALRARGAAELVQILTRSCMEQFHTCTNMMNLLNINMPFLVTLRPGWFLPPDQLYLTQNLPVPLEPEFQGISGRRLERHLLEAAVWWMGWLLGLRLFCREQGDPKGKFQGCKVNPLIIRPNPSESLPMFLLWYHVCLTDILWSQNALSLCSMTCRWCNEGSMIRRIHSSNFTGIEQIQGSKSYKEVYLYQVQGNESISSDTVLLQTQPSLEYFNFSYSRLQSKEVFLVLLSEQMTKLFAAVTVTDSPISKNITKLYYHHIQNGMRQTADFLCSKIYIHMFVSSCIYVYLSIWNIPNDKDKQLLM